MCAQPTVGGECTVGCVLIYSAQLGREKDPGEPKTEGGMWRAGQGICLCSSMMVSYGISLP